MRFGYVFCLSRRYCGLGFIKIDPKVLNTALTAQKSKFLRPNPKARYWRTVHYVDNTNMKEHYVSANYRRGSSGRPLIS